MSILCDFQIEALCSRKDNPLLEPFNKGIQDGGVISSGLTHMGYDFRLGFLVFILKNTFNETLSPKRMKTDPEYLRRIFDEVHAVQGQPIVIPPNGYALGYTLEYIRMPPTLKGHCVGKSSLARCAVIINTTPLEPGWEGHLTLEIGNLSPCPVEVYAGEGIAQVEFFVADHMPDTVYDSNKKYQSQGPNPVIARVKP
jgi:dCTP deaminase